VSDDRPFLQIPLTSDEDFRLYEEWLRKKKQKEDEEYEDEKVVIITI